MKKKWWIFIVIAVCLLLGLGLGFYFRYPYIGYHMNKEAFRVVNDKYKYCYTCTGYVCPHWFREENGLEYNTECGSHLMLNRLPEGGKEAGCIERSEYICINGIN